MSALVECPHCSTRVLPMAGRICPACRKNVDTAPEPQPDPEQDVEAVHEFAAEQMTVGVAPAEVRKALTERGLDDEAAARVVDELKQEKAIALNESGRKKMLHGAMWCIGGLFVTAYSYRIAANASGGRYLLAWGAIVFGAIQFFRGALQSTAEQPQ
jgi:hypothetical protein